MGIFRTTRRKIASQAETESTRKVYAARLRRGLAEA